MDRLTLLGGGGSSGGGGGGGSGPPLILTGLLGWWDSSVTASFSLSGSNVLSITDQSGNGNTLVKPSDAFSPTYNATGFNSLPTMVFAAASGQGLAANTFALGTGNTLTVFAACTLVEDGQNNGRLMSYLAPAASHDYNNVGSFTINRNGTNAEVTLFRNSVATGAKAFSLSTPHRLIATINSSGVMTIYVDNVASTTATASGNWLTNGAYKLGSTPIESRAWTGAVAEAGVATGYSDATTVGTLDTYLKTKWGL